MSSMRLTGVTIQGNQYTYSFLGIAGVGDPRFKVVLNDKKGSMATARAWQIVNSPGWSETAIPIALTSEMRQLIADFRRQENPNGLFRQSVEAINRLPKTPSSKTFTRCLGDLACFDDPSKKLVAGEGGQWLSNSTIIERDMIEWQKFESLKSGRFDFDEKDYVDSSAWDVDADGSVDEFEFSTTDHVRVKISNCIVVKGADPEHWGRHDVYVCGPLIHSDTHMTSSMRYLRFVDEALQQKKN